MGPPKVVGITVYSVDARLAGFVSLADDIVQIS
jgi:hypothetical protein